MGVEGETNVVAGLALELLEGDEVAVDAELLALPGVEEGDGAAALGVALDPGAHAFAEQGGIAETGKGGPGVQVVAAVEVGRFFSVRVGINHEVGVVADLAAILGEAEGVIGVAGDEGLDVEILRVVPGAETERISVAEDFGILLGEGEDAIIFEIWICGEGSDDGEEREHSEMVSGLTNRRAPRGCAAIRQPTYSLSSESLSLKSSET